MPTPCALVTGGGKGLGRALTLALCAAGIDVIIIGRHAESLAQTKAFFPHKISALPLDLALPDSWQSVAKYVASKKINYLIHNAAVSDPVTNLADITLQQWRSAMSINVEAPLFLTQQLLPQLSIQSRVLFISTGAASIPISGLGAYCCAKATLEMVRKILSLDLAQRQIFCASLLPGVVDTQMQTNIRDQDATLYPVIHEFKRLARSGQLRQPSDVADFIVRVLLQTTNEKFVTTQWNIDNPQHRLTNDNL